MASRTIVFITGGNNGIGYEAVKALMQSSKAYEVLMGSRSTDKAKVAIDTLHKDVPDTKSTVAPIQVDLDSDQSIESAFGQVKAKHDRIDVLINNAGISPFRLTFDVMANV